MRVARKKIIGLAAILAIGTACSGGADDKPDPAPTRAPSTLPSVASGCPPLPPAAKRPKGMIDIELPTGSVFVEPASQLGKGVRADLFIPLSVKQAHRFFLKQAKRPSRKVVFSDYEGFEAEVFFREDDGRLGLIRVLLTCHEGSIASIETFKR